MFIIYDNAYYLDKHIIAVMFPIISELATPLMHYPASCIVSHSDEQMLFPSKGIFTCSFTAKPPTHLLGERVRH
jgi:hypothetical protein